MKTPIQIWIGMKCFEEQNLKTIILAFSKATFRKIYIFRKDKCTMEILIGYTLTVTKIF